MLIKWSFRALSHLEEIYSFYRDYTKSEKIASKLYNDILDEAIVLESFPLAGKIEPALEDLPICYRSLVVKKHYKIIYYISKETVYIAAVWDCRMNPEDIMNAL